MKKFFKTTRLKLKPEIAPGICPHCDEMSSFVSIVSDNYRCVNCGLNVEQKINGIIQYLPIGGEIRLKHEPKES